MVRVYSYNLRCDSCGNFGPFGWLYQCSQDREEILRDHISIGDEESIFDDLGKQFIPSVQPRSRGPERRSVNAANFLDEIPQEEVAKTYTTDQLLTIYNQRKHFKSDMSQVGDILRRESVRKAANVVRESNTHDLAKILDQGAQLPWVPTPDEECKYKVCPYCRSGGADRAFMSLDGIAGGDIPATAATGFGFHLFRRRPVCQNRVVANLGLRQVLTCFQPTASSSTSGSGLPESRDALVSKLANHLASQLNQTTLTIDPRSIAPNTTPQAQLPRSPVFSNLAAQAGDHAESVDGDSSWVDSTTASITLPSAATGDMGEYTTEMEEHEQEEGKFSDQPLEVPHGVAVVEESVEMHKPDILTQV
ncbi:hypothetical protein CPLU01_06452 [Colletotrichum plurivorum]|uniref:Uncharacterized protein n=1 Tax=Colletotrichum plurivorum TaxID=2175906 RepID=A0A8H6NGP4_9PEZI|nr:hypothetical protein CPLU01_06452 [Colletotrichum plurivorum]